MHNAKVRLLLQISAFDYELYYHSFIFCRNQWYGLRADSASTRPPTRMPPLPLSLHIMCRGVLKSPYESRRTKVYPGTSLWERFDDLSSPIYQ